MKPFFFFGTLRHTALIEAVVGDTTHIRFSPAQLPGFCVEAAREGPFPTIFSRDGATSLGLLAEGITEHDQKRLDFYEKAFGYDLAEVVLADGRTAQAYMPTPDLGTPNGPWSFDAWVDDWAALSVISAHEVMSFIGKKPPESIARMFPMIRARGWSRLNAQTGRHGAQTLRGKVEIADHRHMYSEYFALDEFEVSHERFDGSMTPNLSRAVFLAPDAAHVLPYDPVRDRVLLVEQMRMGPLARGDQTLWQLEPIAGRLDPGETPQAAVRREAVEESGMEIGQLHAVGETYCSPGNSSEFHYTYVGIADLPDDVAGVGGLESEDEDIRSHLMTFDALLDLCDTHQIANAPLVLIAYWLARHRNRLRAAS